MCFLVTNMSFSSDFFGILNCCCDMVFPEFILTFRKSNRAFMMEVGSVFVCVLWLMEDRQVRMGGLLLEYFQE